MQTHTQFSFVAGPCIHDRRLFVGRKAEINTIIANMCATQPTSVNVHGPRRIGKSSLLYHVAHHWQDYMKADANCYVVAYLSLQQAQPSTPHAFFTALAETLRQKDAVQSRPELLNTLQTQIQAFDGPAFADILDKWKQLPTPVLPVICIDEFEYLLEHQNEFNNNFYDFLRSLLDDSLIMLVIASKDSIVTFQKKHHFTSLFFNLGHMLPLGELTEEDADKLVRLPESTMPGAEPLLKNEADHQTARSWGGRHPYLLQLACKKLYEMHEQHRNLAWAKKEFDREASRVPGRRHKLKRWLAFIFWLPRQLGRVSRIIGTTQSEITDTIIGMVFLVILILIILGVVNPTFFTDLLNNLLS